MTEKHFPGDSDHDELSNTVLAQIMEGAIVSGVFGMENGDCQEEPHLPENLIVPGEPVVPENPDVPGEPETPEEPGCSAECPCCRSTNCSSSAEAVASLAASFLKEDHYPKVVVEKCPSIVFGGSDKPLWLLEYNPDTPSCPSPPDTPPSSPLPNMVPLDSPLPDMVHHDDSSSPNPPTFGQSRLLLATFPPLKMF